MIRKYATLEILLVFALIFGTVALVSGSPLYAADTTYISNTVQSSSDTGGRSSGGTAGKPGGAGTSGSTGQSGQDGRPGIDGSDGTVISSEAKANSEVVTVIDGAGVEYSTSSIVSGDVSTAGLESDPETPDETTVNKVEKQISILESLRELLLRYVKILF